MIRLETNSGEVLSRILKEVSPMMFTSNKQVNRLLDGSYHVQIIGSPLKSIEGTIISSLNQANILNQLIDQGELLVFIFMDKKYLGYIDEDINWKRVSFAYGNKDKSYFEGKMKMVVIEEVVA